ncbi:FAD-binding domain-containing protein [Clathrospora elynae]|uniref:FAD-binding domain-containing protein n=1 Tax=Clathrospora elynae TaxID=706981 RepID=A0A6A5SL20_9PLEO|nr:FAD-binding domain-containing protein [Clathrospora elynae]
MSPYTYNHTPSSISSLLTSLSSHSIPYSLSPPLRNSKANTPHSPVLAHETPLAIIFPVSTEETSTVLKACHERRIAVTSFSGGTSFGGALTSTRGGVCVSFERMDRVLGVHEGDMDVVVQTGVGWVGLNEWLLERTGGKGGGGLWFPVDPAPGARIGGMIAMSCSGTNAYRYGTMKESVISLTCVLANGTIIKTHNRPRKSSAGYDLTHLIIGSEGTLALVTEAVLRLAPLPKNLHVGIATFSSFQAGVGVVLLLQKLGHKLEALELADGEQMHSVNHSGLSKQRFEETPTLFFKIAHPSLELAHEQIAVMHEVCQKQGALTVEISSEEERVETIWGARKCMGVALLSMKKAEKDLFIHSDCAVPISNLARLVDGTRELIRKASAARQEEVGGGQPWFCANVGHIGDGNVHSSIICPASDKSQAEAVLLQIARLALGLEGTVTGEHGVGLKLRDALEEEVGQGGVEMMRRIKRSLDERGILNPDKVFRLEDGSEAKSKL